MEFLAGHGNGLGATLVKLSGYSRSGITIIKAMLLRARIRRKTSLCAGYKDGTRAKERPLCDSRAAAPANRSAFSEAEAPAEIRLNAFQHT